MCGIVILDCYKVLLSDYIPAVIPPLGARHQKLEIAASSPCSPNSLSVPAFRLWICIAVLSKFPKHFSPCHHLLSSASSLIENLIMASQG